MRCNYRHNMWCNCKKPTHKPTPPTPQVNISAPVVDSVTVEVGSSTSVGFTYTPTDVILSNMVTVESGNEAYASISSFEYNNGTANVTIQGNGAGSTTITITNTTNIKQTYTISTTVENPEPQPQFTPNNSILLTPMRGSAIVKFFAEDEESEDYVGANLLNNSLTNITYNGLCEGNEYCEGMFNDTDLVYTLGLGIGNYIDEYGIPSDGMEFADPVYEAIESYFAGEGSVVDINDAIEDSGEIVVPVYVGAQIDRENSVLTCILGETIPVIRFTIPEIRDINSYETIYNTNIVEQEVLEYDEDTGEWVEYLVPMQTGTTQYQIMNSDVGDIEDEVTITIEPAHVILDTNGQLWDMSSGQIGHGLEVPYSLEIPGGTYWTIRGDKLNIGDYVISAELDEGDLVFSHWELNDVSLADGSQGDTSNNDSFFAVFVTKVPVESIEPITSNINIDVGETTTVVLSYSPQNADDFFHVGFDSTNLSVSRASGNWDGEKYEVMIQGISAGTATVTGELNGTTFATFNVCVSQSQLTVTVSTNGDSLFDNTIGEEIANPFVVSLPAGTHWELDDFVLHLGDSYEIIAEDEMLFWGGWQLNNVPLSNNASGTINNGDNFYASYYDPCEADPCAGLDCPDYDPCECSGQCLFVDLDNSYLFSPDDGGTLSFMDALEAGFIDTLDGMYSDIMTTLLVGGVETNVMPLQAASNGRYVESGTDGENSGLIHLVVHGVGSYEEGPDGGDISGDETFEIAPSPNEQSSIVLHNTNGNVSCTFIAYGKYQYNIVNSIGWDTMFTQLEFFHDEEGSDFVDCIISCDEFDNCTVQVLTMGEFDSQYTTIAQRERNVWNYVFETIGGNELARLFDSGLFSFDQITFSAIEALYNNPTAANATAAISAISNFIDNNTGV